MSYLADAHRDWHNVHGKFAVCPLDCGIGEAEIDRLQDEYYDANPAPWDDDPSPYNGTYSEE